MRGFGSLRVACAFLALLWLVAPGVAQEAPRRIVAVGDVHGSPGAFRAILETAGLVDGSGDWIGGDSVLVQTGDLLDRGTEIRALLDYMRRLERSASENGGRLVSLLGNHEVYNLIGFFDYQSTPLPAFTEIAADFADESSEKTRKRAYKEWGAWSRRYRGCGTMTKDQWMALHPLGFIEYLEALSPRGEYGRWLRDRRVVANVGGTLFLHGGLSPALATTGPSSIEKLNEAAAEELRRFDQDREILEAEGITLPFSTLGEVYCAMAHETRAEPAGSLSPAGMLHKRRLEEISGRLPSTEAWLLLHADGPVWFRGYASWTGEEAEEGLDKVFATFGGNRVVVGHTPQMGNILARFEGRVFLIDTAMAYADVSNGRPAALEIQGDSVFAIYQDARTRLWPAGEAEPVPEAPEAPETRETVGTAGTNGHGQDVAAAVEKAAVPSSDAPAPAAPAQARWLGEDGNPLPFATDEELLEFLATAPVVDRSTVGKGITKPQRLVLEKDGLRVRAIFHDVRIRRTRHRLATGEMVLYFRDSYENNVAAYLLSRLMGINNVPPVTVRRLDGEGSIQLWIEDSYDEEERNKRGSKKALPVRVRRRIDDMWVFDNLINNIDRNQGNMLYDSSGSFWLIDHTRSFARAERLPSRERIRRCSRSLFSALKELNEEDLTERLSGLVDKFEVASMLKRRDKVVQILEERIARLGEDKVLFEYGSPDDAVSVSYDRIEIPPKPGEDG